MIFFINFIIFYRFSCFFLYKSRMIGVKLKEFVYGKYCEFFLNIKFFEDDRKGVEMR